MSATSTAAGDRRAGLRAVPARRRRYAVTYEPGVAHFAKTRGDLAMDYDVFVPPDFPGDMRLLRLENRGAKASALARRAVLRHRARRKPERKRRQAQGRDRRRNAAVRESAQRFPARRSPSPRRACPTSGPRRFARASSTERAAISDTPALVDTGASDLSQRDDGRRVAAFASDIELAPGAEMKIAIVLGQAGTRALALAASAAAKVETVERELAATRAAWAARLGKVARDHQPARLRPAGQHLAALSALRLAPVRPRRAQPARRRLRLPRPVAGRAAADPHRAAARAGADRAARRPAVPGRRRAEMVASRAQRRDRRSPSAPARATRICGCPMCSRATSASRATRACSTKSRRISKARRSQPAKTRGSSRRAPRARAGDVYEHGRRAIEYHDAPHRRQRPAAARRRRLERRHRRPRPQGQGNQRLDGLLLLRRAERLRSAGAAEKATKPSPSAARRRAKRCGPRWRPPGAAIITRWIFPTTAARSKCRTP